MRQLIALGVFWGVWCTLGVARAGVADDFREAASRRGCASIPYASERAACTSGGREVDDWCKTPQRPWNCDRLDPTPLRERIASVSSKMSELKKEREELESKRGSSKDEAERKEYERKIDDRRAQLEALQQKIDEWNRQIAADQTTAREREEIGVRCVASRAAVQRVFADVKARVQRESDPDAKQYAAKIVETFTGEEAGHQEAINLANRAVEKCRSYR